jgi:hypothetical protein
MPAPKFRAALASLALVSAAGLSAVAVSAPAQAATAPVDVHISKGRVVSMPTTIQPGVNTFHIVSANKRGSAFQIVQAADGYTPQEASSDIEKGLERGKVGPLKRFEANVTLLGGVTAQGDAPTSLTVTLPAGTYWALDTNTNDPAKFFVFTAAGADTGNVAPSPDVTLKAKGSTKWANSPKSMPKKGTMTFTNAASQNHFIEMARLKKGATVKDVKKWLMSPEGPSGPPPLDFSASFSSGVVSPGHSMTTDYKLPKKGNYVMLCFWPDASMGGMPHAFMGMVRGIKVK